MKFRVKRDEFVTNRPFWLIKVLLQISPVSYSFVNTQEEAIAHLKNIHNILNSARKRKGVVIHRKDNIISIQNEQEKKYSIFYIIKEEG